MTMATTAYDDKTDVRRDVEPQIFQDENPEKPIPKVEKVDYSGAHEKTDPKEIALVKKLDRWMMVSILCQISLNRVLTCLAHALEHVLAQLSGPKCHCPGSSQ